MPGPDEKAVFARIQKYAAENMPDGGNLGQLNNELMAAYGKSYIDDMGYGDFRALLSSVPDIKISKNRAFSLVQPVINAVAPAESAKSAKPEKPGKLCRGILSPQRKRWLRSSRRSMHRQQPKAPKTQ